MVHVLPPAKSASTPLVAPVVAATPLVKPPTFEEPVEQFVEPPPPAAEAAVPSEVASVLDVASASNANFIMWAIGSFVVGVTLMGTFLLLRGGDAPAVAAPQPTTTPITHPSVPAEPTATVPDQPDTESPTPTPSPGVVADKEPATKEQASDDNPFAEQPTKVEPQQVEPSLLGPLEQPVEEPVSAATPAAREYRATEASDRECRRTARPKFDSLAIDPRQLNLGHHHRSRWR